jgi:NAD/NADP transhydrogenase alpha subunit
MIYGTSIRMLHVSTQLNEVLLFKHVVVVVVLVIPLLVANLVMYAMHTMVSIVQPMSGTTLVTAAVLIAASLLIGACTARQRVMPSMKGLNVQLTREFCQLLVKQLVAHDV